MNRCAMCRVPCWDYLCPECKAKEEVELDITRRNDKLDEWFCHLSLAKKEKIKGGF